MSVAGSLSSVLFAFFPILFWGYAFSYLDNSPLNARRFLLGLLSGGAALAAILGIDRVFTTLSLYSLNPFLQVSTPLDGISAFFWWYALVLLFIAGFALVLASVITGGSGRLFDFANSVVHFFALFPLIVLTILMLEFFGLFDLTVSNGIHVSGIAYASVGAIIAYYLMVSVFEEAAKHWGFLSSARGYASLRIFPLVLAGTFVALGFAFTENVLYLSSIAGVGGIADSQYWQTWWYRSVFSVLLHTLASTVIIRAMVSGRVPFAISLSWGRYLIAGVAFGVLLHLVFNISLALGFSGMIFAYLVGGYVYFTRMIAVSADMR